MTDRLITSGSKLATIYSCAAQYSEASCRANAVRFPPCLDPLKLAAFFFSTCSSTGESVGRMYARRDSLNDET